MDLDGFIALLNNDYDDSGSYYCDAVVTRTGSSAYSGISVRLMPYRYSGGNITSGPVIVATGQDFSGSDHKHYDGLSITPARDSGITYATVRLEISTDGWTSFVSLAESAPFEVTN